MQTEKKGWNVLILEVYKCVDCCPIVRLAWKWLKAGLCLPNFIRPMFLCLTVSLWCRKTSVVLIDVMTSVDTLPCISAITITWLTVQIIIPSRSRVCDMRYGFKFCYKYLVGLIKGQTKCKTVWQFIFTVIPDFCMTKDQCKLAHLQNSFD